MFVPAVKKSAKKVEPIPAGKYGCLVASSPAVDVEVEGTKISFLEHQRRTVAAMLDAEKCAAAGKYTAGLLRDPLGSGKTHCIVGLLALRNAPALTQIGSVNGGVVRRRYSRLFRANIVFVGASVLANWEAVFALTSHRLAVVRDIRDLRRLHAEFARGDLPYDDILVKNGLVTAALDFPELRDTPLEFSSHRSILSVFGLVFRDVCFGRVVLDDFDTLEIAPGAMIIPAWFTWYVSSTASSAFTGSPDRSAHYENPYDALEMSRGLYIDQLLYITQVRNCRLPIVSSQPDYVVESTSMTPVYFWKYYHKNPHAAAIAAIGVLGHGGLAEMLNADALTTAAESVGNAGLGVGGIFKKLLGDNHAAYLLAGSRGRYCSAALDYCSRLGPRADDMAAFSKLIALRENCLAPGPRSKLERMVQYRSDDAIGVIKVVGAEAKAERDASGTKIARVRERLQEGECPIMCVPLAECKSIFMLDCCQIVLSDEAINSACVKVHMGAGKKITGECPMCRAKLSESLIIPIDAVNIDDIIEENMEGGSAAVAAEAVPDEEPAAPEPGAVAKRESVKYSTFVAIANGTEASLQRESFKPELRGLMVGVESRGSAPPAEKKFLYIAKYEETFRSLVANLEFEGRRFAVFRGLRVQKNEIVRRYWLPNDHPESLQIVLITDAALCAGVNLQNTTDIIAAHGMPEDPDIMSQFMARAARCGRKYDLHAHALLYEEEQF